MLYRDFSRDYARPSFPREVQYDLRECNTIGFKGVRVQVLEATNLKIRYRVNATFPDPEIW